MAAGTSAVPGALRRRLSAGAAAIAYDNGYWTTYRELDSYRIT
jgi:hypothetical protein